MENAAEEGEVKILHVPVPYKLWDAIRRTGEEKGQSIASEVRETLHKRYLAK